MVLDILFLFSFIGLFVYLLWVTILFIFPKKKIKFNISKKNINKFSLYILMPMLNEKNVARKTVEKFFNENKEGLDIHLVIIDDGSIDGTTKILQELEVKYSGLEVIYRKLPYAQQGKSEALNIGINKIRENNKKDEDLVIVGILDADAFMNIHSFKKVISAFSVNTSIAMVQVAVGMLITNKWLHWMQDIEFQSCNNLIQNTRNYFENVAASGNGQFFKLSCVDKGRIWHGSLLEDFEFSTNLLMKGKKTVYLEDSIVYQEPVNTMKTLYKQRIRWCQGGIECLFKYTVPIIKNKSLKLSAKIEMLFYMLIPFITSISLFGNIFALSHQFRYIVFLNGVIDNFLLILLIISILINLRLGYLYSVKSKKSIIKSMLISITISIYNILLGPISYVAIFRFITKRNEWSKTDHGVDYEVAA